MVIRKLITSLASQKRIAGGALVLAITGFGASVCGFFRDQAFSVMFPLEKDPIGVASVYIAAFRPSDLLFQIFVMSSLSVVLVPFLAGHLAHGKRDEMNRITCSILTLFGVAFGLVALILAIVFPYLAPQMVKFTGPSLELYIRFGRLALLTNVLFVIGNTIGQYLIAVQKYWIYGITPILWAIGTISGIYLLTPVYGPMGAMYGTIIGTIIYIIIRGYGAWKAGFRFALPDKHIVHDDVRQMGWLIIPRMAALGALQLQLLLLDRLGSGLGPQVVATNQFASNFESVIPGIAGIAIAQSVFSLLSQAHAKQDQHSFWRYIRKAIVMNAALTIPGAFALALLAGIPARLLHLHPPVSGIFTAALIIYAIAVPFESTNHILLRSFYSMKNTGWPALTTALSSGLGIIAAYLLVSSMGIYALAVGYVTAQVSQTLLLGIALMTLHGSRKKISPVVAI